MKMQNKIVTAVILAFAARSMEAGPLIRATSVVGGCSLGIGIGSAKNVTVNLNQATFGFYFSTASESGLVFIFTPASGSPSVFSIAASPANHTAVGFQLPVGTYNLVIHDRNANGTAGTVDSPAYSVSVARCVAQPGRSEKGLQVPQSVVK